MKLASDSFRHRAALPDGDGHPQLRWRDVPAGTASLALVCMRADAPGGDFLHWGVVDLPPTLTSLAAGALPAAPRAMLDDVALRQGVNDVGTCGYHRPLPLQNETQHYIFRLYALDVARLALPSGFRCADVMNAIYGHIVDEAQLIGTYTPS